MIDQAEGMMPRYSTAAIVILLTFAAAGATAQETKAAADKPPATTDTTGMAGDKSKNAESAPTPSTPQHDSIESKAGADTVGTANVSPGVGTVQGGDGKPPLPSGGSK
jgi:hypothetical protein